MVPRRPAADTDGLAGAEDPLPQAKSTNRLGRSASLRVVGIESPVHLLFLGVVALLVLGPKRLPELARALGKGVREFRESIDLGGDDHDSPTERDRRDG